MPNAVPRTIGRYDVHRSMGCGGVGALYVARDPAVDRLVAIKVLREGLDSRELRERFAREARSAARLRHPNIVTIFDFGEHEGKPFIAMEYIHGETLADLIGRQAALPLNRRLQIMEDLCSGLHYAHRSGIVHRDIKPANVMLDEDGVVKILDFGIARDGPSERSQEIVGTLNYMAPEVIERRPIDHRADIFALGALFYELLSYRRAFQGVPPGGVLSDILAIQPVPLTTLVPELDPSIAGIVDRCLEKNPDDRYSDCLAVAKEIANVRRRLQHAD